MNTSSECSDDDDSSAHKPPKRMKRARRGEYKFNDAWLKDDSFKNWLLKLEDDAQNVHCRICVSNITIKHRGVSALTSHMQGDRHRKNVQQSASPEDLLHFYNEPELNQDQEQSFDNETFKLTSQPPTTQTVKKRRTEVQPEDNLAVNHLNAANESGIIAPTVLQRMRQNVSRQEEFLNLPIAHLRTPKDEYEAPTPKNSIVRKRKIGSQHDDFLNPAMNPLVRLNEEVEAIPPTAVIKKWKNRNRHDELLNLAIDHLNTSKDEYETIASAWAIELQKMEAGQQIFAKRFISEIIFEGQLGSLHRNSMTMNMQHARWYPSPASSSNAETQNHVSVKDNSINHDSNS